MYIKILKSSDLEVMVGLQTRVLAALENDYFLKCRSVADWRMMLGSEDYVVYGIYDKDRLIASATIHFPNGVDYRDIPEFSPVPDEELAIFQAVMVDKDYRRMGLMRVLQDLRKGAAIRRKRGKIICKISADNLISCKNAINYGFHAVKVAPDDSGHNKMYFIKKLNLAQGFLTK